MSITALPTPPSRSDPTNFASRGDAFLGALPTFATECNATASAINASQIAANNSAIAAAASASAAASTTGVVAWVSGTTYNSGDNVYSLINFLTYRRKITGAGTTDPSADNTNWQLLTGQGDVTSTGANTLTNNLNFSGTGLRFTGDFTNGTYSSRLMFQTSTVNSTTSVGFIPSGTGSAANIRLFNNSNPTNSSALVLSGNTAEGRIEQSITGTGTYYPLTFWTGGAERIRILTDGRVGFGTASPSHKIHAIDNTNSIIMSEGNSGYGAFYARNSGGLSNYSFMFFGSTVNGETARITVDNANTMIFSTGNSVVNRLIIDSNSQVLAPNCNGIGYSTGSGGTVVQSPNKGATVTLNKASGYIIMSSAALGSNSTINFILLNSCFNSDDLLILNIQSGVSDFRNYYVWAGFNSNGSVQIALRNISGSTLSEAVVLNFAIIKGSST